jgi:hypothetical protein
MATGTQGTSAVYYATQTVHYLRKNFTYADNGKVLDVGTLPAGAQMLNTISGVFVTTVFNAGTGNVLDIGTSADDDLYATDLALGTKAFVALDETAATGLVNTWYVSTDTKITATPALSGTAATTGAGVIVIAFLANNAG